MLVLLMLMLMSMLPMLALTMMLLLNASDVVAYAIAYDANADAKIPNVTRHLASAYAVRLLPRVLPMSMLLSQLLRAYACDVVMLKCVCICVRLCLSTTRSSVCYACVCALERACIYSAGAVYA